MSPLSTHYLYAPYEEPPACARLTPLYAIPRKYSYSMSPPDEAFNSAMIAGDELRKPARKKRLLQRKFYSYYTQQIHMPFVSI